jgi:predicted regulator of Ras-like GTPase activity (Roadblock/LC7/MglB family)
VSRVDAAEAIAELRELSTQIEAVVLASRDGELLASSLDSQAAATVAASAGSLIEGADAVRRDLGREALAQVQASTAEGSVFVVVDEARMAIAVTGADPTVGLVFYDLKTLLRQTADAADDDRAPEPEPAAEKGDGDGEA